jgi:hypothetical protein
LRDADFIYKAAIPCGKTDTCNENEELNWIGLRQWAIPAGKPV